MLLKIYIEVVVYVYIHKYLLESNGIVKLRISNDIKSKNYMRTKQNKLTYMFTYKRTYIHTRKNHILKNIHINK